MTWNIEQITKNLMIIENRIKNSKDDKEIQALKFDYETLIYLLNILKSKKKQEYDDMTPYKLLCSDFVLKSADSLISHKSILSDVAFTSEKMCLVPLKRTFWGIKSLNYPQMLYDFFCKFSYEELFQRLHEGSIYATKKEKDLGGVNGKCFYLFSLREAFIMVNSNLKKSLVTIPHEVAHVVDFNNIADFQHILNWHYSSFCESYPKFLELAFLDSYQNSSESDCLLQIKRNKLVNLQISSEYYLAFLNQMEEYNPLLEQIVTRDKEMVSKKSIDNIVSDILAFYMYYLYKNDMEAFNNFLRVYHSLIGQNDEDIWHLLEKIDLNKIITWVSNEFNESIYLRSRKK